MAGDELNCLITHAHVCIDQQQRELAKQIAREQDKR